MFGDNGFSKTYKVKNDLVEKVLLYCNALPSGAEQQNHANELQKPCNSPQILSQEFQCCGFIGQTVQFPELYLRNR